jgi:single-strand DNA-binding protein
MNSVILIGRLTRDPELRYTAGQMAVANFTLAVDRPIRQDKEKQADFPQVTVFGKQAEACEKYLAKGRMAAVQGRIQTGSYKNREGATVYTTDVIAESVKFLERGDKTREARGAGGAPAQSGAPSDPGGGFAALDEDEEDIPF